MASVVFKGRVPHFPAFSVKCGWINTPEHPGYPPKRKPSGATIAQVARFNAQSENPSHRRDFADLFFVKMSTSTQLRRAVSKDISKAIRSGSFDATSTRALMQETLIGCITDGEWMANTPAWSKFKADNNLHPDPLIASQVMLNSITTEVSVL